MITLHTWTTPNGRKISIMLEELGIPYLIKTVNLIQGEQFSPAYQAISPTNKIPVLSDSGIDGRTITVFESGAILQYLAEKTGQLLPDHGADRYQVLEWLHWQTASLGPVLSQLVAESTNTHLADEADRLLGVMDRQLTRYTYMANEEYSIADIACYPWVAALRHAPALGSRPHLRRWINTLSSRAAVQRGMALPRLN
ncbi:glutathione S-transferase family protein [Duganella callida]|uniref:Glutathione S-transferase family protein n=1 Tax=Duganella callida TaxID=2561932 RepID=A0A4Y9S6U6_9BURK|nr:glutathione S-transferase N-terminal domain-containing protein [Duganella callida]TFW17176.1 glutathione S-transferase family protein [Duganella callida]